MFLGDVCDSNADDFDPSQCGYAYNPDGPNPGDSDFVGPVQIQDSQGSMFTLPVEVFNSIKSVLKIIQPGGAPTYPYPVPGTYGTPTTQPSSLASIGSMAGLALLGLFAMSSTSKKRTRRRKR